MTAYKTSLLIVVVLALTTLGLTQVHGQTEEPLDVAKKVFGKERLSTIENYIVGEYQGQPNGQDLPKGSTTKFLLLGQTEKTAVVNLTVIDSTGHGLDTYLHFKKDTTWKISAFRTLAMTGIIGQMVAELEKMTPQQVDAIIQQSKENTEDGFAIFTSREDYTFQVGKAKLLLEVDDNIANHFLANRAEFERLKNLALREIDTGKFDKESSEALVENEKENYRKLFISSISTGGYELGNCIVFLIGGMMDNTVGYIYVQDKKDVPTMSPSQVIMIREIGNGWYMYKTT